MKFIEEGINGIECKVMEGSIKTIEWKAIEE
jgi:hypothetical protein